MTTEANRDEFPAVLHAPTALAPMHVRTEIPGRGGILAPGAPTCHRCGQPATAQWQRAANDNEREAHWAALEAHIRAQPNLFDDTNATFTADYTELVTHAVYGCDEHQVPDATLLHAADCGGHQACQCGGEAANV